MPDRGHRLGRLGGNHLGDWVRPWRTRFRLGDRPRPGRRPTDSGGLAGIAVTMTGVAIRSGRHAPAVGVALVARSAFAVIPLAVTSWSAARRRMCRGRDWDCYGRIANRPPNRRVVGTEHWVLPAVGDDSPVGPLEDGRASGGDWRSIERSRALRPTSRRYRGPGMTKLAAGIATDGEGTASPSCCFDNAWGVPLHWAAKGRTASTDYGLNRGLTSVPGDDRTAMFVRSI